MKHVKHFFNFGLYLAAISTIFLLPLNLRAEVNPDGSFGYTVNIQVPPGTHGIEPKLRGMS
ncbi:MAG: hypothetical protein A2W19_02460 [Spirochaetes bacterium RBG_16_49_21]|nr:MAG: hypothetical protein A2W19_02460 [Spirochaetes bacterium RBG_16_49_21]